MDKMLILILFTGGLALTIAKAPAVQEESNDIIVPALEHSQDFGTRPPYNEKARRARYIVHKADWALVATISTKPEILGRAFPTTVSLSDGTADDSSGTPYFYLASIDSVMKDIAKNPNVTLSFSEAEFPDVQDCAVTENSDPENPLCARLMLFGTLARVTDSTESAFAKSALFSRHPLMPTWPKDHDFQFYKLAIDAIWMLDYFGGGSSLSIQDYYKAKP